MTSDDAIDYAEIAAEAVSLIEANGRPMTFYRKGRAAADTAKPWNGPTTDPGDPNGPVTYSDVIALPYPIEIADAPVNGIRSPLKSTLLVAAESFPDDVVDVTTLDEVNDGDIQWKICYTRPLKPGSTPLIYEMGLEG